MHMHQHEFDGYIVLVLRCTVYMHLVSNMHLDRWYTEGKPQIEETGSSLGTTSRTHDGMRLVVRALKFQFKWIFTETIEIQLNLDYHRRSSWTPCEREGVDTRMNIQSNLPYCIRYSCILSLPTPGHCCRCADPYPWFEPTYTSNSVVGTPLCPFFFKRFF